MTRSKNILFNHVTKLLILILIICFLIPSSLINLYNLRIFVITAFIISISLICIISVLSASNINEHFILSISLTILAILIILFYSNKNFELINYKFLIYILLIFASSSINKIFVSKKIISFFYIILNLYICYIFFNNILNNHSILIGEKNFRYDFTGSVTSHSINCLIYIFLSYFYIKRKKNVLLKLFIIINSIFAIYMLFLVAGRQFILITLFYFTFLFFLKDERRIKLLIKILSIFIFFLIIFSLFTIYINDNLYLRLFENNENFSSGRLEAIKFWYNFYLLEGPLGVGFIYANSSNYQIDWPHNEFIRFYLEVGFPGLIFIILILTFIYKKVNKDPLSNITNIEIYFPIMIFSIIIIQLNFDNFIESIYRSFLFFFIIIVCSKNFSKN